MQNVNCKHMVACIAECDENFCFNGGTCLPPDKNCTCPEDWTGDRCNISSPDRGDDTVIIASTTAAVAGLIVLTVVLALLVYVAVVRYRRKRRVKFIQASIRYSGFTMAVYTF